MTWLELLETLKEQPYYLLENEIIITSDGCGGFIHCEIENILCPSWDGVLWDKHDGLLMQMRLKRVE